MQRKKALVIGAGVAGGATLLLALMAGRRRRGGALVIYLGRGEPTHVGTFRAAGQQIGRLLGVEPIPITSGQEILDVIRRHRNISTIVFVGHASAGGMLFSDRSRVYLGPDRLPARVNVATLARTLAPRLGNDPIIALAGCRSGADYREDNWSPETYGHGGATSFASRLRDELVRNGIHSGDVRAHTTTGAVLDNPHVRVFPIERRQLGQPGRHVIADYWGEGATGNQSTAVQWSRAFQGEPSRRYLVGLPTGQIARPA